MGVDHNNVANEGRQSVRVSSNLVFDSGLIIADIKHMPGSICGIWPAFWTFGPDWPNNGEIDIIEGVHDQDSNSVALHTNEGCTITDNGNFSGEIRTPNCDVNAPGQDQNAGCGIGSDDTSSYGDGFNAIEGGVYATEISAEAVTVWWFPRSRIPGDITAGAPDPASWSMPMAQFQGDCDIPSKIREQSIIFDTTFCGDWAGNVWSTNPTCSALADSCESYVANNPSEFEEAYWLVNSIQVYSNGGSAALLSRDVSAPAPAVPVDVGTETLKRRPASHRRFGRHA